MKTVVIDVREPFEFKMGHYPGALNIPPAAIMQGQPAVLADLPRGTRIVVYCRTGARSGSACRALKKAGFTNVHNLKGGVPAWQQASLPIEK